MEKKHEIHEKTFSMETMHSFNTPHTHIKEVDSHIFNFETSMITSKYHDTSHMSKPKRDMAIQQDQLKTPKKDATLDMGN